ncbi:hypothetical protein BDZ88DRAFT_442764 [Geranomyces variabilis]|nr:hypothetical protein BDZ88DRAFT_442764 [Geranomyces variabilis]KAJ3132443.1 hypothetical protein HDU90_006958 [Geranomyces variabilis]
MKLLVAIVVAALSVAAAAREPVLVCGEHYFVTRGLNETCTSVAAKYPQTLPNGVADLVRLNIFANCNATLESGILCVGLQEARVENHDLEEAPQRNCPVFRRPSDFSCEEFALMFPIAYPNLPLYNSGRPCTQLRGLVCVGPSDPQTTSPVVTTTQPASTKPATPPTTTSRPASSPTITCASYSIKHDDNCYSIAAQFPATCPNGYMDLVVYNPDLRCGDLPVGSVICVGPSAGQKVQTRIPGPPATSHGHPTRPTRRPVSRPTVKPTTTPPPPQKTAHPTTPAATSIATAAPAPTFLPPTVPSANVCQVYVTVKGDSCVSVAARFRASLPNGTGDLYYWNFLLNCDPLVIGTALCVGPPIKIGSTTKTPSSTTTAPAPSVTPLAPGCHLYYTLQADFCWHTGKDCMGAAQCSRSPLGPADIKKCAAIMLANPQDCASIAGQYPWYLPGGAADVQKLNPDIKCAAGNLPVGSLICLRPLV